MPIAVGMYLPFGLATPILVGGIIAHLVSRKKPSSSSESKIQDGILLSSGLIAGESLMGIFLAFIAGAGITKINLEINSNLISGLTIIAIMTTIYYLYEKSNLKHTS